MQMVKSLNINIYTYRLMTASLFWCGNKQFMLRMNININLSAKCESANVLRTENSPRYKTILC